MHSYILALYLTSHRAYAITTLIPLAGPRAPEPWDQGGQMTPPPEIYLGVKHRILTPVFVLFIYLVMVNRDFQSI